MEVLPASTVTLHRAFRRSPLQMAGISGLKNASGPSEHTQNAQLSSDGRGSQSRRAAPGCTALLNSDGDPTSKLASVTESIVNRILVINDRGNNDTTVPVGVCPGRGATECWPGGATS